MLFIVESVIIHKDKVVLDLEGGCKCSKAELQAKKESKLEKEIFLLVFCKQYSAVIFSV